jgi:hypothetical protein
MKVKKQSLQSQFDQEKTLWKTERGRLLRAVEQLEVENETLRLSIERSKARLGEDDSEDEPEDDFSIEVVANPESRLSQRLSPSAQKYIPQPKPDAVVSVANAAPLRIPLPKTAVSMVKSSPPRAPQPKPAEFVDLPDTGFPQYSLNFDYCPTGNGRLSADGKETVFDNGDVLLVFRGGKKKIKTTKADYVHFGNGDVQIDFRDGATAYRYQQTGAVELNLPDGTAHCVFPNGQREVRFGNGDKYIVFPDRSTKYAKANGDYQIKRPDGRVENCVRGIVSRSQATEPT